MTVRGSTTNVTLKLIPEGAPKLQVSCTMRWEGPVGNVMGAGAIEVGARFDTLVTIPCQTARPPVFTPAVIETLACEALVQELKSPVNDAETSVIVEPVGNVVLPDRLPT